MQEGFGGEGSEVVAHRAGNTVSEAARAVGLVRQGSIDMIEADIHVYRGRVEVRHAKVLKPTTRMWEGRHLLPRGTAAVPLAEILEEFGPDVELMADLKCFTTWAARRICRAIPEDQPVVASTRSWWVLRAFHGRARTRLLRSCGNRPQLWAARRFRWPGPPTGFAVHERRLSTAIVEDLLAQGHSVFSWGANTKRRCVEMRSMGVTGFILDDTQILVDDLP